MTPVTDEEFEELLRCGFDREAAHLETRDAYGTAVELPHMAKWAADEPDDLNWLKGWCTALREHVKAGRSVQHSGVSTVAIPTIATSPPTRTGWSAAM